MNTTKNDADVRFADALRERIGQERYDLWFAKNTIIAWEADALTVGVPNWFFKDWLQKQFAADLRAVAEQALGHVVEVSFRIDPHLFRHARQHDEKQPKDAPKSAAAKADAPRVDGPHPGRTSERRHVRSRRLEDFVVGACNRVAHAALVSMLEDPGSCPTPLVLHGPVGLGKSHLLEGMHVELREQRPDARILHLTAEDFTNRFLGSMHAGKQGSFRRQFRDCDMLLVDDLHFLARKTATQEEFLHTLEALQRDHRPVVVTCDCHPRLAEIFLPELTDRLAGGAVWGLSTPDVETRRRILAAKVGSDVAIDPATLDFLAEKLRGNVRELEGALHSVKHLARVTGQPITPELAQEALAEVLRASIRTVQLADIERAVTIVFGLGTGLLQSRQRRTQVSYPRMLAMFLARKHTGATYSEVGHFFGKRNHSTVVAAEKKVRLWLAAKESLPIGAAKMAVRDLVDRFESELAR